MITRTCSRNNRLPDDRRTHPLGGTVRKGHIRGHFGHKGGVRTTFHQACEIGQFTFGNEFVDDIKCGSVQTNQEDFVVITLFAVNRSWIKIGVHRRRAHRDDTRRQKKANHNTQAQFPFQGPTLTTKHKRKSRCDNHPQ